MRLKYDPIRIGIIFSVQNKVHENTLITININKEVLR